VKLAARDGAPAGASVAPALLIALLAGIAIGMVVLARREPGDRRGVGVPFGPSLRSGVCRPVRRSRNDSMRTCTFWAEALMTSRQTVDEVCGQGAARCDADPPPTMLELLKQPISFKRTPSAARRLPPVARTRVEARGASHAHPRRARDRAGPADRGCRAGLNGHVVVRAGRRPADRAEPGPRRRGDRRFPRSPRRSPTCSNAAVWTAAWRIGIANQRIVMRQIELPPITDPKGARQRRPLPGAGRDPDADRERRARLPLARHRRDRGRPAPAGPARPARRDMVERMLLAAREAGCGPRASISRVRHDPRGCDRSMSPTARQVLYLSIGGLTNLAIASGSTCSSRA